MKTLRVGMGEKATRLCQVPSERQLGNMMVSPSVCQDGKPGVCGEKKVASMRWCQICAQREGKSVR